MKQKVRQSGSNQAIKRLGAEKKKIIIAVALIALMAVLWLRIFLKKADSPAVGSSMALQTAVAEETQPKIKTTFVELPKVKGRNDVLSRDIFAGAKWEGLGAEANGSGRVIEKVKSGSENLTDNINQMVGNELKLEAIFSGKNPQASVGGVLVSPGGKLALNHEGEKYEFKVVAVNQNEVVLECKGVSVKLSMARPNESVD